MTPENTEIKSLRKGSIELICGCMFSGKTEELIRRLKRAKLAKQEVQIFKPTVDKRYDAEKVVSHDANFVSSIPVDVAQDILNYVKTAEVIGIDEGQFFDDKLLDVCNQLANNGKRVIVAGLDMDYKGRPFGPIPALLSSAEHITKFNAVCMHCGDQANYSHRTQKNNSLVMLGEKESYEALCRNCFNKAIS